jgi:hypothetical protein
MKARLVVREYATMSNGQVAAIFLYQEGDVLFPSFIVANSKTQCNKWAAGHSKLDSHSTGKCGMEALLWGKGVIVRVMAVMPEGMHLMIWGADEKRHRAYRALCRIGFTSGWDWDGITCYGYKKGGDGQG